MRSKSYYPFVTMVVLALLAGACAPAAATPTTQAVPQETSPTLPAAEPTATVPTKPVTLQYWSYLSETEPLAMVLAENVKAWNAANPNIQVEPTWVGRELVTKLRTQLLAGEAPDIISYSDSEALPSVVKEGLIQPLDDALKTPGYNTKEAWGDTFVHLNPYSDGHFYLIPDSYYTSGIYYNKTIFAKFNLAPPTTWSEFLDVCKTLKSNAVQPLAVDGAYAFFPSWYFVWLASRIVGDDAFRMAAQDKTGAAWGDPGFLEAAKQVQALVQNGYFQPGYEGTNWPGAETLFSQGNVGMYLTGTWFPAEISDKVGPDFDMAVIAFPSVEGGKGDQTSAEAWANSWMILKDSKYIDQSISFLKYMTGKEAMAGFAEVMTPAPLKDVPLPKFNEGQATILANADKFMPRLHGIQEDNPEWVTKVFWVIDDKLAFGQVTPEQFIAQLMTEQAKYFSK